MHTIMLMVIIHLPDLEKESNIMKIILTSMGNILAGFILVERRITTFPQQTPKEYENLILRYLKL